MAKAAIKPAVRVTVTDTRAKAAPHARTKAAEAVNPEPSIGDRFTADLGSMFTHYGISMPSGTRVVISLIASLCLGGAIGYFGGSLLGYAMVGALILTGSAFIAWSIYILGIVALIYAGYKAGGWVGDYILNRKVDRHIELAGGWFKAKREAVSNWMAPAPLAERVA